MHEELELKSEQGWNTKEWTEEFVTRSKIQTMMSTKMEKLTIHPTVPVLTEVVEYKPIDAQQGVYDAAKQVVETHCVSKIQ